MKQNNLRKKDFRINTDLIEEYRSNQYLTISQFCKLCKIDLLTYCRMINHEGDMMLSTLMKIGKVMNVELCELFF